MTETDSRDAPPISFGVFEFDPSTGTLRRHGRPVPLRPQPARVLALLVARAGRVVTRIELRRHLWGPDTYVDAERGINTAVRLVRRALGDDAGSPRYVQTLPGRGYRFVAPVVAAREPRETDVPASAEVQHEPPAVAGGPASSSSLGRARHWLVGALVLAAAVLTALLTWHLGAAGTGTTPPKPWIVASFANHSGSDFLDDPLHTAFRIGLSRSTAVRILPPDSLRAALGRMGLDPDASIDRRTAAELALREGAAAAVLGRCDRVGRTLRVSAEVIDPQDGRTLGAHRADAVDPTALLAALDRVISQVREDLGERLPRRPAPAPLEQVTTPDLVALTYYSRALSLGHDNRTADEAMTLIRRALERDPEFGMAHARLGSLELQHGSVAVGREHLRTARRLSHRLSEPEQLYVEAWLRSASGHHAEIVAAWERFALLLPDDPRAHFNLGAVLMNYQGSFSAAESAFDRAFELNRSPERRSLARLGRGLARIALGRGREGLDDVQRAAAGLDPPPHVELGLALLSQRRTADLKARLSGDGTPVTGDDLHVLRWHVAVDEERFADAAELAAAGRAAASAPGRTTDWLLRRLHCLEESNPRQATVEIGTAVDRLLNDDTSDMARTGPLPDLLLAQLAARRGDPAAARRVLDRVRRTFARWVPEGHAVSARAEILLAEGRAEEAADLLADFLGNPRTAPWPLHLAELRSRVLEASGDPDAAARTRLWVIRRQGRALVECLGSIPCYDRAANLLAWNRARRHATVPPAP